MISKRELLALKCVNQVGDTSIQRIIDSLQGMPLEHSKEKGAVKYNANKDEYLQKANSILNRCNKEGIKVVSLFDKSYPSSFNDAYVGFDKPPILFCKGDLNLLQHDKLVAVIGARENTQVGEVLTNRIVNFLLSERSVIVSGLALGIDSIAHKTCIDLGGKTISVLVDVSNIVPSRNGSLASDILSSGGLLISENPPGTKIVPALFSKRNRIQAALSKLIIPIETTINGGTMHTINKAIEYKRSVYVPDPEVGLYGSDVVQNEGIKQLIKEGMGIPFTKKTYSLISNLLNSTVDKNSSNFGTQQTLSFGDD